jgi:hypothetical protein
MKTCLLNFIFALVACFALATAASAQTTQETPESVAKAYFAAIQAGDWEKCASLMHPDALASMKRIFGAIIRTDKSGEAAKAVFGLKSSAEYDRLSEAAVFERLWDFILSGSPEVKAALAASTSTVLGQVTERSDLVHVVYRTQIKIAGSEATQVDLISFRRQGGAWRALLTSDMEEMFSKLAEGLASASKEEEKSEAPGGKKPERKP